MDYARQLLIEAFENHKAGRLDQAEPVYNQLLNRSLDDPQLLYLLGDLYCRRGYNGLACTLFHASLSLDPSRQEAWIDLGVALRAEHYNELAKGAWLRALELGENLEVFSNMATLYADSGKPEEAMVWLDKALSMNPEHWESQWNKALALLTMKNWEPGWRYYENRVNLKNWDIRPQVDVPTWDGSGGKVVYLHGEQGVGDEIMFLSCVNDVLNTGSVPVLEVNSKLAGLVLNTWPELSVFSNVDDFLASGIKVDAKLGLGSLGRLFRNRDEDFPGLPYLKPDPALVDYYRGKLQELGPGPYFAVAWVGGVKSTRVHERSIPLQNLVPILAQGTAVCAQYGPLASEEASKVGLPIIDDESRGGDLASQAALFAACDAVVTVVQTAVHLAGALGVPAYVLTPARPSWRYGVSGDMPWYNSVRLFRQGEGEDWGFVISRVAMELENDFRRVPQAEQEVA
jgi:hypothetical protein